MNAANHKPEKAMRTNDFSRCRAVGNFDAAGVSAQWAAARSAEPAGKFEVHDVELWILEPGNKMANRRDSFPSALPVTVPLDCVEGNASRDAAMAPIGMLTFHGQQPLN